MSIGEIALDDIQEEHLSQLVEAKVSERQRLEFKRELPGGRPSDRREFLADVSSLANAAGGDIVYGMKEAKGIATALEGLEGIDQDRERTRLEEMARDGISPRVNGLRTHATELASGKAAIVLRVPPSWTVPHMVVFNKTNRFWGRGSTGKFLLDVNDLRTLFARSRSIAERIRRFRDERLARIVSATGGVVELAAPAVIVLHFIPFGFEDVGAAVDLTAVKSGCPELLRLGGGEFRYNLDGLLRTNPVGFTSPPTQGYALLFRTGVVEVVDSSYFKDDRSLGKFIPSQTLEQDLARCIRLQVELLHGMGVGLPLVILMTVIGAAGYAVPGRAGFEDRTRPTIDRDVVSLPEAIIEDWHTDLSGALRPMLDGWWNAGGWEKDPYFEDGRWVVLRQSHT